MLKPFLSAVVAALVLAGCASAPPATRVQQSLHQTTPVRKTVASTALAQVGDPYAANMAGPNRYDNPGLAYYCYRENGRALPRSLDDQLNDGQPIALSDAEPGDLVFFRLDTPDGRGALAVGILASENVAVIAVPGTKAAGGGVRRIDLSSNYWQSRRVGVVRILNPVQ